MLEFFKKKLPVVAAADTNPLARPVLEIGEHLQVVDDVPHFTGTTLSHVFNTLPPEASDDEVAQQLTNASRSWMTALNHQTFAGRLSSGESKHFMLLGDVPPARGKAILSYAEETLAHYEHDLVDIMWLGPASKFPLIVLSDYDDYFRYVASFFPDGEYGLSSGMFLSQGLGHFVLPADEHWHFEPVVSHELLHAVVAHLPLPAWLNEGLASNAEFRYGGRYQDPRHVHDQLVHHKKYWTEERLQMFWNGDAFHGADEGQALSYDLARRIVLGLSSSNWPVMRNFVLKANVADAGEAAANELFGHSLSIAVEAVTGVEGAQPNPSSWKSEPVGGAYQ
jgi:hypothetical protein